MPFDRLRQKAQVFARELGCSRFSLELAEKDFRDYLESDAILPDYPPWGARAEWVRYTRKMITMSGHGNPLSPLIFVGSELAADPENYQELYFKFCFDLLWRELFGCRKTNAMRTRFKKAFLKFWGGAGREDKAAGYHGSAYYRSLRYELQANPAFWTQQSFVNRHIEWHSNGNRGAGHYFGKTSQLILTLRPSPLRLQRRNATALSCNAGPQTPFSGFEGRDIIDDFAFFTESSLDTAAAGERKVHTKESLNEYPFYALDQFKQNRIFLFSPTQKKAQGLPLQDAVRTKLNANSRIVEQRAGNASYPLTVYRHNSGHYAIVFHTNLTQSVSNNKLVVLAQLVRKYGRKL